MHRCAKYVTSHDWMNFIYWFLQVRDVLKGILKPGSLFYGEELTIKDNHYRDDMSMSDGTPGSQKGLSAVRAMSLTNTPNTPSSFEMSSSPDSSSPEYSDGHRNSEHSSKHQHSSPMQQLKNKMEVELSEIKMTQSFTEGQATNKTDERYPSNKHFRSNSVGNHGLFGANDSLSLFDSNRNRNKSKMSAKPENNYRVY